MITKQQKKFLKSLLHHRDIVIWIGQKGLYDNVSKEIDEALNHHELIKMRIRNGDKEYREKLAWQICKEHHAELIQKTGSIYSIYRRNEDEPVISLPD